HEPGSGALLAHEQDPHLHPQSTVGRLDPKPRRAAEEDLAADDLGEDFSGIRVVDLHGAGPRGVAVWSGCHDAPPEKAPDRQAMNATTTVAPIASGTANAPSTVAAALAAPCTTLAAAFTTSVMTRSRISRTPSMKSSPPVTLGLSISSATLFSAVSARCNANATRVLLSVEISSSRRSGVAPAY